MIMLFLQQGGLKTALQIKIKKEETKNEVMKFYLQCESLKNVIKRNLANNGT